MSKLEGRRIRRIDVNLGSGDSKSLLPREKDRRKDKGAERRGSEIRGRGSPSFAGEHPKFQSTIRPRYRESLLALRARVPEEVARRGKARERERENARGNNLLEIRLVARSASGDTLICPRGNLSSTATLLPAFSIPPPHRHRRHHHTFSVGPCNPDLPPFPHSPTPAPDIGRLLSRRGERETPSSPTGILNTDDSSVLFLRSSILFPLPSSFLSCRDPLDGPSFSRGSGDGIRERLSPIWVLSAQCSYS